MRISAALLLLLLLPAVAYTQPGPGGPPRADRQLERQQLRGELRGAARLQRPPESDPPAVPGLVPAQLAPARHLNPRERAELRQQLRQEQLESRRSRS